MSKRNSPTRKRQRQWLTALFGGPYWSIVARVLVGLGIVLAYVTLCTLAGRCVLRLAYGYWHAPPGMGTNADFLAATVLMSSLLAPVVGMFLVGVIFGLYRLGDATLRELRHH